MATTAAPNPAVEAAQSNFELGVSLALHFWPALSLAVSNNWGGANSAEKRDWFSGAVIDLFTADPATDLEDVETVLLQVMQDEFEVVVDDESAFEVAEQIMRLRVLCGRGDFAEVVALRERWERKAGGRAEAMFKEVQRREEDDETDGSGSEFEGFSDGEDVEMGGVAVEATPKEKIEPEVDDEGFTKVVGKKRR